MLLISPKFDVNSIIVPNFGQGHFPKISGKSFVLYILQTNIVFFSFDLILNTIKFSVSENASTFHEI